MSPEGRVRFGRYLGQKAQRQGHDFIDLNQDGIDDRLQDPDFLAQKTSRVHREQPGLLSQLFGSFFDGTTVITGGTATMRTLRSWTSLRVARKMEAPSGATSSEAISSEAATSCRFGFSVHSSVEPIP
jgi:hypothetical protein